MTSPSIPKIAFGFQDALQVKPMYTLRLKNTLKSSNLNATSGYKKGTNKLVRYCRALLVARVRLEVRLAVERGGEGHVVEGTRDGVGTLEGWHALNAIFRLVGRQLSPQLVRQNVWLKQNYQKCRKGILRDYP